MTGNVKAHGYGNLIGCYDDLMHGSRGDEQCLSGRHLEALPRRSHPAGSIRMVEQESLSALFRDRPDFYDLFSLQLKQHTVGHITMGVIQMLIGTEPQGQLRVKADRIQFTQPGLQGLRDEVLEWPCRRIGNALPTAVGMPHLHRNMRGGAFRYAR